MSNLKSDVSVEEMSDLGLEISRDGQGPFSKKGENSGQDQTSDLRSDVCRRPISRNPEE